MVTPGADGRRAEGEPVIARVRRWISSWWDVVELDDVVIVPLEKWHQIIGERDRLRLECERLRALLRGGV
jgi:hypothetical protein